MMERYGLFLILILVFSSCCSLGFAEALPKDSNDLGLFALPFEEVMDIEVFSVTRTKGQDVFTSPAAIYVITQEEIRRSGHRSIPELLRMVPGLYVAQIDAGKWVISSRGFPERFYHMMLVQIDGRTLYSPIFSGVFWESQDYILDDIERIEIIRGTGGSLWGANAFHGIINIITKSSKDTQGGLVLGGADQLDKGDLLWYHRSLKWIFMECVMPIFEYKCAMCGAVSEFLESAGSRKKHVCEKCDGTDMKKMLSSFSPMVKQRATGGKCSSCPEAKCPYSG